jgi:hypothetical protein
MTKVDVFSNLEDDEESWWYIHMCTVKVFEIHVNVGHQTSFFATKQE